MPSCNLVPSRPRTVLAPLRKFFPRADVKNDELLWDAF